MNPVDQYKEAIASQCIHKISFFEKRPGIYQVTAPFYHEDGDMVELFVEPGTKDGFVKISDYGMTVMRLSYDYELDSPNKAQVFQQIAIKNRIKENDGCLFLEVPLESLYPGLMQLAQGVSKVGCMRYFKKEVIKNLFYEMLDDFIMSELHQYRPIKGFAPIPNRDDLEVDYMLGGERPIYLFGVKGNDKARLATICCLEFQKARVQFSSAIVHEDMGALGRKDITRITSAADKQFPSLDDFKEYGKGYFEREILS